MAGPLEGLKVVEFAGIGPGPFAAMLLADLGTDVLRIERPGASADRHDVTARNRSTIEIDLRAQVAAKAVLQVLAGAHLLIEGFRPGVMGDPQTARRPLVSAHREAAPGLPSGDGIGGP